MQRRVGAGKKNPPERIQKDNEKPAGAHENYNKNTFCREQKNGSMRKEIRTGYKKGWIALQQQVLRCN